MCLPKKREILNKLYTSQNNYQYISHKKISVPRPWNFTSVTEAVTEASVVRLTSLPGTCLSAAMFQPQQLSSSTVASWTSCSWEGGTCRSTVTPWNSWTGDTFLEQQEEGRQQQEVEEVRRQPATQPWWGQALTLQKCWYRSIQVQRMSVGFSGAGAMAGAGAGAGTGVCLFGAPK